MKIDGLFPSKYLKASDVDEPLVLRISGVEVDTMNDGSKKPVLYFSNSAKGLVLNKTNANVLSQIYGDETGNWEGKPIKLIASTTDFQGKVVDCIRLRPPKSVAASAATKAAVKANAPEGFDDLDDSIDF